MVLFFSHYFTVLHLVNWFFCSPFSLFVLCFSIFFFVWFDFSVFLAHYMLSTMVRRIQSISVVKGLRGKWVSLPPLGKVTCLGLPQLNIQALSQAVRAPLNSEIYSFTTKHLPPAVCFKFLHCLIFAFCSMGLVHITQKLQIVLNLLLHIVRLILCTTTCCALFLPNPFPFPSYCAHFLFTPPVNILKVQLTLTFIKGQADIGAAST